MVKLAQELPLDELCKGPFRVMRLNNYVVQCMWRICVKRVYVVLPWPKKLGQPRKPNYRRVHTRESTRLCPSDARLSHFFFGQGTINRISLDSCNITFLQKILFCFNSYNCTLLYSSIALIIAPWLDHNAFCLQFYVIEYIGWDSQLTEIVERDRLRLPNLKWVFFLLLLFSSLNFFKLAQAQVRVNSTILKDLQ